MPNVANETLKRLRGNRSKEEVARAIGISVRALESYERGERIPKDEVKVRIANYYGRTVQYIFFK